MNKSIYCAPSVEITMLEEEYALLDTSLYTGAEVLGTDEGQW